MKITRRQLRNLIEGSIKKTIRRGRPYIIPAEDPLEDPLEDLSYMQKEKNNKGLFLC